MATTDSGWISPDDALKMSKDLMLEGRDPETREDWMRIVNCLAVNLHPAIVESACLLMVRIYDMPLSEEDVKAIVKFQEARRKD